MLSLPKAITLLLSRPTRSEKWRPDVTRQERIVELERQHLAEAQELDLEVLTPKGARWLFNKTAATVRLAARKGLVESPFTLHISDTPVRFLRLSSAIRYWGEPEGFAERLEQMRSNAYPFGLGRLPVAVLHTEPVATLSDGELE